MLCLQGPGMLLQSDKENEHHQAFFVNARIFEISRALIYTEPTFLSTPEWSAAAEVYWAQHPAAWTHKEALFDVLPQFVDLAIRTLQFTTDADIPWQDQHHTAAALAQDGLALESRLSGWYASFSSWTLLHAETVGPDSEDRIALVYYYTISIYLDGIFSYHTPFTGPSAPASPTLDYDAVETFVEKILTLSQEMLVQGCAGILLFFPLRVAGARARDSETRSRILCILQLITQRGFTVAQSFVTDLSQLWGM